MRKIKIVQIGVGHDHASAIWDCLLNMPDIFDFAAFAVPDVEKEKFPERIAELSKKYRFSRLMRHSACPGLMPPPSKPRRSHSPTVRLQPPKKGCTFTWINPADLSLQLLKS